MYGLDKMLDVLILAFAQLETSNLWIVTGKAGKTFILKIEDYGGKNYGLCSISKKIS